MSFLNHCKVLNKGTLHFLNKCTLILLLIVPALSFANEFSTTILQQSQNSTTIKINFNKPTVFSEDAGSYTSYSGALLATDGNGALVPVINKLVNLAGSNPIVSVVSEVKKSFPLKNYILGDVKSNTKIEKVSVSYVGKYRDLSVFSLSVKPVSYSFTTKKVTWLSELVIKVTTHATQGSSVAVAGNKTSKSLNKYFLNKTFYNEIPAQKKALNTLEANGKSESQIQPGAFSVAFKIVVNAPGIYKVSYQDLLDEEFPFSEINPKKLALFNKGKEIPIYFSGGEDGSFDPADYIEFWGEKNEKSLLDTYEDVYNDPFSDENVYWLVEKGGNGQRLIEENGAILETAASKITRQRKFLDTIHFEQDKHRELLGKDVELLDKPSYQFDHWYWSDLISNVGGKNFEFHLPHPYPTGTSVYVKAMLRGVSIYDPNTNPIEGHQVSIFLDQPAANNNDALQKVGDVLPQAHWLGQTKRVIKNETPLSQRKLIHGTNILRVQLDQENVTDIVLFNWFDITYYREYRADDDFIKFRMQDGTFNTDRVSQFDIPGFTTSDIDVYKIGVSKIVNTQVETFTEGEFSYKIILQDKIFDPNVEYVALTEKAKKSPLKIEKYIPWKENNPAASLLSSANSADLLIITNKIFAEKAEKLKQLKQTAGFTPEVVHVSDIYNAFNDGIKSPLAIKEFIQYAYNNWDQSKKLEYVILAGDASYNPKDILDLVPTIMYTTQNYGAAPADIQFAFVSGDDIIPDVKIGRIPASSLAEFDHYLEKIENYQNTSVNGVWRNRSLWVSGSDGKLSDLERGTNKPVFRAQNNRLIHLKLPKNVFASKLNTLRDESIPDGQVDPNYGGSRELIDYIDNGVTYINFLGHGGGGVWSDEQIFTLDRVEDLNNEGKYPFISSMTCFTGAFENPNREGLAEKVLMADKKGAIAVLSSSSVGWKYNDFAIMWGLHDFLWQKDASFGEAVDMMKISYLSNPVYYYETGRGGTPDYNKLKSSMVHQYNLLGDPTLVMKKTPNSLSVKASKVTPEAGEQITIALESSINTGVANVEIKDQENKKYLESNFAINGSLHTFTYAVPDTLADKALVISAYISDGINEVAGYETIYVERSIIKNVVFSPATIGVNEPISFEIEVDSFRPIDSVYLSKFRSENSFGTNFTTIQTEKVSETLFRSTNSYKGFPTGGKKFFEITVRDTASNITKHDLRVINVVDTRPDLELDHASIGYSGSDNLAISFIVKNPSQTAVENVRIWGYDAQGIANNQTFFDNNYNFAASETKELTIPYSANINSSSQTIKIEVDPLNAIDEFDEENNGITEEKTIYTDHLFVDFKLGTTLNGVDNGPVNLFDKWQMHILPNGLSASSVIQFKPIAISSMVTNGEQKDLKFIPIENSNDTTALHIKVKNGVAQFTQPAQLSAQVDSTAFSESELNKITFFKFDSYLGLWVKIDTEQPKKGLYTAQINTNGLYALFSFEDNKSPFIEITANGRSFNNEMLVRINPAISFLLQDENGIDLKNTFTVEVDNVEIPESDLSIPDSITSANSIAVVATPQLEIGDHTLKVKVSDINGNEQTIERTFVVSGSNKLTVYGNYPNPFSDETIISYELESGLIVNSLSVKIYTLSGRLIRTKPLESKNNSEGKIEVGYDELTWDGLDDDGNSVANGVYFVVIKAEYQNGNEKISSTKKLKVARLK